MLTLEDAPKVATLPTDGYHNGNTARRELAPIGDRQVIAWDMEGMSLSGADKPQHAVIFGSSASEPKQGRNLGMFEMLEHIFAVDRENPGALHVGFGWRYDANMLVKGLAEEHLRTLNKHNRVTIIVHNWRYTIHMYPGKWFQVSRCHKQYATTYGPRYQVGVNSSIKIYDFASFFQRPFIDVCSDLLRDQLGDEDHEVIRVGKEKRGSNQWEDLPEVLYYWRAEIQLIRRTFELFRDVMVQAGFAMKDWYGPGALANFIIAKRGLRRHLAGAQITSGLMPNAVHEAAKRAFAGGRFELFRTGRVRGPIHVYDINSAYPHALRMIPSLAKGAWVYRNAEYIRRHGVDRFGVYHMHHDLSRADVEYRPMPLFHRDHRGLISFPGVVDGWYMSPEARMCAAQPDIHITEGWVWVSASDEMPWEFLQEMYDQRQRLGKKNLLSLPFKLGPNSIYGKLAQTVGWDKDKKLPPKTHALLVAAWITSLCRSMLWVGMMSQPDKLIAVETDSIVTTATPEEMGLKFGDGLGEWGHETYSEIIYIQSGMYYARRGDEWLIHKTRGLDKADVSVESVVEWMKTLQPGKRWPALKLTTKPRFQGLAYALHTATADRPMKERHCVWQAQEREVKLGETGKRHHVASACPTCRDMVSINDQAHPVAISLSRQFSGILQPSQPRRLPWEREHTEEIQSIRDNLNAQKDLVA